LFSAKKLKSIAQPGNYYSHRISEIIVWFSNNISIAPTQEQGQTGRLGNINFDLRF
jgi:hypothetical protein